jgi:hypothetical protein
MPEGTAVDVREGTVSISESAFEGKRNLTSITIPNSVKSIGEYAFLDCIILTSITIPNSVTSIGSEAFYGCSSLTDIVVESGNENYSSFDGVMLNKNILIYCPGGKSGSYTIPEGVTSIGDFAFVHCSSLTSVTNLNPKPQVISARVFYIVDLKNATLYVPAESIEAYKAAALWKEFGKIVAVGTD